MPGFAASKRRSVPCPGTRRFSTRRNTSRTRSEEHTSELQSRLHLVCRLLLEKKKKKNTHRGDSLYAAVPNLNTTARYARAYQHRQNHHAQGSRPSFPHAASVHARTPGARPCH